MTAREKKPEAASLFDGQEELTPQGAGLPDSGHNLKAPARLEEIPAPPPLPDSAISAEAPSPPPPPPPPAAPIRFLGQARVKTTLQRILDHQRLANAYMFTGPSGSGRFAAALELARALNCQADSGRIGAVCGCPSCRNIARLQHPNLHLLVPLPRAVTQEEIERNQKFYQETIALLKDDPYAPLHKVQSSSWHILIDQIRDVRQRLALVQDYPGSRVVILNPAGRLNEEAANAFLKHLEEPVAGCCIVLIAGNQRELPATIVSRCQNIRFAVLAPAEIAEELARRYGLYDGEALQAAEMADGSLTRAISSVDGSSTERLNRALEFLRAAAQGNTPKMMQCAGDWSESEARGEIAAQMRALSVWLQNALSRKVGMERTSKELTVDQAVIKRLAERYASDTFIQALGMVEETRLSLDANAIPNLALIALGLKLKTLFKM